MKSHFGAPEASRPWGLRVSGCPCAHREGGLTAALSGHTSCPERNRGQPGLSVQSDLSFEGSTWPNFNSCFTSSGCPAQAGARQESICLPCLASHQTCRGVGSNMAEGPEQGECGRGGGLSWVKYTASLGERPEQVTPGRSPRSKVVVDGQSSLASRGPAGQLSQLCLVSFRR